YTGALQTVTYDIPAYRFEGCRVFTNKPPCGPKRGHGTPQPRFAIELHLEKIAHDLGIDAVEMKRRNFVKPMTRTVNWLRVTSCGLEECTRRVMDASGFRRRERRPGHGMGFAISSYLSGAGTAIYWNDMPHSEVQIKVDRGGVTTYCGAMDIGQGSDSVLAAVVAEELGLQPRDIRLVTADTDTTPIDLGSYSSRVTFMAGNAALEAARKMRALLVEAAAGKMQSPPESVSVGGGRIGDFSFEEASILAEARFGTLATAGSYTPPKIAGPYKGSGVGPSPAYSYSACVVELDADHRTGLVHMNKVWIAHDVGRAINPLLVEGQVEGSVYMGLGEALMEEQTFRKGLHKWPSMLEYKSPTFLDMPDVKTRPRRAIRSEGGGSGSPVAGHPRGQRRGVRRVGRVDRRGPGHAREDRRGTATKREGRATALRPARFSRHPLSHDDQSRTASQGAGSCCACLDLNICARRARERPRAWRPSSARARCSSRVAPTCFRSSSEGSSTSRP
ncbi:MAG: hypothetical protein E6J40_09505, partial [Chloroflexi bacterium]